MSEYSSYKLIHWTKARSDETITILENISLRLYKNVNVWYMSVCKIFNIQHFFADKKNQFTKMKMTACTGALNSQIR